jgi:chromosome segregation ATPase
VQTLEQSLAGQAPELARVTALATSCQEENASLTHSLEIAQAVRGKLEAESKEKTQKLQNTEASLMACESALKELQEVHQSLQAECREAKEQCSAYQTDAQRSGSTVAELRAAVDQLAHSKQVGKIERVDC